MDTAEVTLRLDRALAERLHDPIERARFEAFLDLVSAAESEAQIKEAIRLLTASPEVRQRRIKQAFASLRRRATAAGLAAEEVDQELAAWKGGRAVARRR